MRSIVLSLTMGESLAIYKRVTEIIMSNTVWMPAQYVPQDVRTGCPHRMSAQDVPHRMSRTVRNT
jgi:hypothetical protein